MRVPPPLPIGPVDHSIDATALAAAAWVTSISLPDIGKFQDAHESREFFTLVRDWHALYVADYQRLTMGVGTRRIPTIPFGAVDSSFPRAVRLADRYVGLCIVKMETFESARRQLAFNTLGRDWAASNLAQLESHSIAAGRQ